MEMILNRFGYYKHPITESELSLAYAQEIGNVSEYKITAADSKRMFEDLAAVEGFLDYLRATSAQDIQRYFAAEDDKQRDIIRGAISRTLYFKGMISKREESKDTNLNSARK